MRIHTSLNESTIQAAARVARADLVGLSRHGSRSRDHAFEVHLEGESRRRPNSGASGLGSGYAATWDQWGVFLATLFNADPDLTIPRVYDNGNVFHLMTGFRFEDGWPKDAHGDHRFEFVGVPYSRQCTKCSAVHRWMI